jgi:hypothetical protein
MNIIKIVMMLLLSISVNADIYDKWKVSVGSMFVTNFETEMQLSPKDYPVGVRINTKDQLGMESETAVFRVGGYYRFNDKHNINISYFRVKSDGVKVVGENIEWGDTLFPEGTQVISYFDMNVLKFNYGYSFYHNKDIELQVSVGLHTTKIDAGLKSTEIVSKEGDSSITVPLPVVGFYGEYTIIQKRLFVSYRADYFALKYDDMKGSFISSELNLEYRFVDHVGLGLGFNSNKIYLKAVDEDSNLEITNDLSGIQLYFTYIY